MFLKVFNLPNFRHNQRVTVAVRYEIRTFSQRVSIISIIKLLSTYKSKKFINFLYIIRHGSKIKDKIYSDNLQNTQNNVLFRIFFQI
jgi:hypothetical protein